MESYPFAFGSAALIQGWLGAVAQHVHHSRMFSLWHLLHAWNKGGEVWASPVIQMYRTCSI
eukprot:535169-Amphidinium_carterae.1